MSSFVRRLKYYGIGFGIGLVFIFFFFQNRGCSWLPSNRVKNAILDRLIVVSDSTNLVLKEKGLSIDDIISALNEGDVEFDESDKDNESKMYIILQDDVKYAFTLPYESFISEVQIREKNKRIKGTKNGFGTILHYPNDDYLVYPDSTRLVTCQQEALGLIEPKKILQRIKKTSRFDFQKSNLKQRPKPEHYLTFQSKGDTIGAKIIWYKNKLNVTSFVSRKTENCK
ncbi:MAG: hypothetical protein QNL61_01110 [Crocinitomicaceae bacterium]